MRSSRPGFPHHLRVAHHQFFAWTGERCPVCGGPLRAGCACAAPDDVWLPGAVAVDDDEVAGYVARHADGFVVDPDGPLITAKEY